MTTTTSCLMMGWCYLVGGWSGYSIAKAYFGSKTPQPETKAKKQIGFKVDK